MMYYQTDRITIHNGDCREVLSETPDDSVDLLVTDPPYGISFMGKDWDKALPDKKVWAECLRVLKPGAFAFVMSIPRSDCQARMVIALQDAGFRVDFTPLYWAYASGFPKASNIGKMVDKRLGAEREVVGKHPDPRHRYPNTDITGGNYMSSTPGVRESGILTAPATTQAKALDGSYGGFQPKPAVEVIIVAMKPLSEKTFVDQALKNGKGITWLDDCRVPYESEGDKEKGTPASLSHHRFTGQTYNQGRVGNLEVMHHQSDSGRFPANLIVSGDVLRYNQKENNPNWRGGSFQGCIVCGKEFWVRPSRKAVRKTCSPECKYKYHSEWMSGENNPKWNGGSSGEYKKGKTDKQWKEKRQAVYKRDDFTCQACGDRSGELHAHHIIPWRLSFDDSMSNLVSLCPSCHSKVEATWVNVGSGDFVPSAESSFSRYFDLDAWQDKPKTFPFLITPKASKSEKGKDCTHPTVKPLKLMSYLITLGSREGDTILDPFLGSGTTALASQLLGRKCIGIEIDEKYCEIAASRCRQEVLV